MNEVDFETQAEYEQACVEYEAWLDTFKDQEQKDDQISSYAVTC